MKSFLAPLKALSYLFREPVTLPIELRPAAPNYRGFHVNDWDKCIGCGTCSHICDNRAIRMVEIPDLPSDPIKGVKPQRPAIDYGRCCWCALCVDVCPTGSLALSREYTHIDTKLDSFFILPDEKGMHGLGYPTGWSKSADSDLLDLQRQPMLEMQAEPRLESFAEIVEGFDPQAALLEASRCIQCGMCHDACPTHMHAPEYIRAIWAGDLEEAVRQIYRTNPLAHVCGRVCTHRCETACSIGRRGEPISIRWLKRYAMDSVPPEKIKKIALEQKPESISGKKVAIVGSGPAGLTTAFDLAKHGHAVTIFESLAAPGGMMRYGIPEYRLPYSKLDADIGVIAAMGVEIRCNAPIGEGQAVTMEALQQDYDAVLVSTGLHAGRSTRVPGTDHPQVRSAIELLRLITLGEEVPAPESIVVIGGGNVAFDIARSLARLQKRLHGKIRMTLTALEPADGMLADPSEAKEAREEGIMVLNSRGPRCCVVENNELTGLETVRCVSIFDDKGRFHPMYDEADSQFHPADMVVEAIGQAPHLEFLGWQLTEQLDWDKRGRPVINAEGRSNLPWLWLAGDVVQGPDVIHSVAAGHRVAQSIHAYLSATLPR
jgi:glutamate synthase (NADPH/NADH) small chain